MARLHQTSYRAGQGIVNTLGGNIMSSVGKGGDVAPLKEVEAAVIGDFIPVEAIEVSSLHDD